MLFNSFEYLIFLPVVFLLYWFAFRRLRWQNLLIVVASYVFYGWWDYRFLILIALTTLLSYLSGIAIEHRQTAGLGGVNSMLSQTLRSTCSYWVFLSITTSLQRVWRQPVRAWTSHYTPLPCNWFYR